MVAGNQQLSIDQSCTFTRTIQWTDSGGTPINLTGYSAHMVIKWRDGSTYTLDTTGGGITITPLTGTLTLNIPNSTTATFTNLTGQYELRVTSGSGVVTRLLLGGVNVVPGVF